MSVTLPVICPACRTQLKVKSLRCEACGTEVHGEYDLPLWLRLPEEDRRFILQFVKSSGSLKDMSRHLGLSYPTVRNLLNEIILKINEYEN
jgi:hypothetical protein